MITSLIPQSEAEQAFVFQSDLLIAEKPDRARIERLDLSARHHPLSMPLSSQVSVRSRSLAKRAPKFVACLFRKGVFSPLWRARLHMVVTKRRWIPSKSLKTRISLGLTMMLPTVGASSLGTRIAASHGGKPLGELPMLNAASNPVLGVVYRRCRVQSGSWRGCRPAIGTAFP